MLEITISQNDLDVGSEEEKAAFGQLEIKANGRLLTGGTRIIGEETDFSPGPLVSGYHLAEWLLWNWWRLRWEPSPKARPIENLNWAFSHRMSTIGEGYVWPNIDVSTDGVFTWLSSERSLDSDPSLFRYSGANLVRISPSDLEAAIDEFVTFVLNRLGDKGLDDSNLHRLWQDLQEERRTPEIGRFRRFEALLGCDPDELDSDDLESHLNDAPILGERAIEELAMGSASIDGNLRELPSAEQIREVTQSVGFDANPLDCVVADVPDLQNWSYWQAWRCGVSAAKVVRCQEKLGDGPIPDAVLASLAGTSPDVIYGDKYSGNFSWTLTHGDDCARVALRPKWKSGRRFELARLIGANIFVHYGSRVAEPLTPATGSESYEQKAQRAFAAELLSPWLLVKEMLGRDYSEENQEQIADYFSVSSRVIWTELRNNEIIRDDWRATSHP